LSVCHKVQLWVNAEFHQIPFLLPWWWYKVWWTESLLYLEIRMSGPNLQCDCMWMWIPQRK
jgi:hypothetical protein